MVKKKDETTAETEIKFDKRNYRIHNDKNKALIAKSLEECGAGRSILIDAENEIIAGNGVFEQAKKKNMKVRIIETDGKELIAVKRTDLKTDSRERKRLAVFDNTTSDTAEEDNDLILEDFSYDDALDLGVDVPPKNADDDEGNVVEDEIPEEVETKCKRGDVWKLGEHRLMCGNSTKVDDVEKLMNGNKADISFQSPPYNAACTPTETKANKKSKYLNDDDNKSNNEYLTFLNDFTSNALINSKYVFVNIQMLSNNKRCFCEYLNDNKEKLVDIIIWDKLHSQPAMVENVLNSEFEFVLCFGGNSSRSIGTKNFRGTESNIVHISKQNKNAVKEHNATFPLEFCSHFIKSFSNINENILDLFGGSGSTLIACEQLNRKCYTMELDEHYCDVIIQRWENLTGKKAEKIMEI